MLVHLCALLSILTLDHVRESVEVIAAAQIESECANAPWKLTWSSVARLARIGEHHLAVVSSTEIVINIVARVDPDQLFRLDTSCEQACVDGVTADSLVLVALNVIIIRQVHELWDRLVEENEVAQVGIVRVEMLLICEPVDGVC